MAKIVYAKVRIYKLQTMIEEGNEFVDMVEMTTHKQNHKYDVEDVVEAIASIN